MGDIYGLVRLDDRAGSRDLYGALVSVGLRVVLGRLPFGDIEFTGSGPNDTPVLIGIEHKRVTDVIHCISDGRFAGHQLPGLCSRFDRVWLVVEGYTRAGRGGALQTSEDGHRWYDVITGRRSMQYIDFDMWLTGIEVSAGVGVRRTRSQSETALCILTLVRWWAKSYDSHRAHLAFDRSDQPSVALLTKPGVVRRMAKELSGVGWERSAAIADRFKTPIDMVAATEEEWVGIDGIGRGIARNIMKELGSDRLWSEKNGK